MAYILLVDDDRENLWSLQVALEGDGHRVAVAEGGRHALIILHREPVQFMITDYEMPDIDGAELCRLARAEPAHFALPIVMLSAAPEPQTGRYWTCFFRKPVRFDELTAVINAHAAVRLSGYKLPHAVPLFACRVVERWPELDSRCWP